MIAKNAYMKMGLSIKVARKRVSFFQQYMTYYVNNQANPFDLRSNSILLNQYG